MRSNWGFMDRLKPVKCTNVSIGPFFNIGHAAWPMPEKYRPWSTVW